MAGECMNQTNHIVVAIGELIYNNMFATGASRCAFEAAKGLSRYYNVTIVGRSEEGFSVTELNSKTTFIRCADVESEQVVLLNLFKGGVCAVITVVDHALESIARPSDLASLHIPLIHWSHLAAEDYSALPGLSSAVERISRVITPTAHEACRLVQEYPVLRNSIAVIPNGIRRPKVASDPIDSVPGLMVMFVGRRSLEKGYDVWLDTCHELAIARSELRFLSIGMPSENIDEYSLQLRAKLLSSGRLTEIAYLSPSALAASLSAASALVLPTRRDCFPVCILEAMHLGVPVIASDIPNLREVADLPPSILLCNRLSGKAFAESVGLLLDGVYPIDSMRERAFSLVNNRYTLERCVGLISRVVEDVVSLGVRK